MSIDIDSLWLKIRDGDEKVFENLFKELFPGLCLYAVQITRDSFLSEEIVQDVFLKIYQARTELVINGSFKAYIFQSVHNQALNQLRHQKTKRQSVNTPSSEELWDFISNNYDVNDNIIDRLISDDTEAHIAKAIDELPEQCGRIFRMSRFDLLTNKEISRKLKLSEHTVKSHIYRAVEKISNTLKKRE